MDVINSKHYKYNVEAISNQLVIKDNKTYATGNLRIIFPKRFIKKNLAIIGNVVQLVGLYGILDDDNNYCASMAPIYQDLQAGHISDAIGDDGMEYKVLHIEADTVLITNNTLIKTDNIIFDICDEIYIKANIPWYFKYDDVPDIIAEARLYCESYVGDNRIFSETLTSLIARASNKTDFYRHTDKVSEKPTWVPINNIYYSFQTTAAKLIGGYYGAGVTAAILRPETATSAVEAHLIKD